MLLVSPLVREYLINYARPLIYTTALSHSNVIAADCVFDVLEDGTTSAVCLFALFLSFKLTRFQLAARVLTLTALLVSSLRSALHSIPPSILRLPTHLAAAPSSPTSATPLLAPILPLLTPHARALAAHLVSRGIDARPITWPTVPRGADRVRLCMHAGNSEREVAVLVRACVEWAAGEAPVEAVAWESERQRGGRGESDSPSPHSALDLLAKAKL
jgi:8-amino-7-oxononanoate synthase